MHGVVLATIAMVVSTTILFLAFTKDGSSFFPQLSKNLDSHRQSGQILRSCLSSDEKKREQKKKKEKRVKFAEDVKETKGKAIEYSRQKENSYFYKQEKENSVPEVDRNYRNEIPRIYKMPANRIALYNGILRDQCTEFNAHIDILPFLVQVSSSLIFP